MSMPLGKKIDVGYSTVCEEGGENYRTIAEALTRQGQPMNHASARNYVLRTMKRFALAFATARGEVMTEEELESVARSPNFQSAISDLIQHV
jgi:hypothetical protein